jgi:hypothetical protein
MAATFTLPSTTLVNAMGRDENLILLASVANIFPDLKTHLYITEFLAPGECVQALEFGAVSGWVKVKRGVNTASMPHSSGAQVFVATPDQLFACDPWGAPMSSPYVVPWINIVNGNVWWPYGDEVPEGLTTRWWQRQTTIADVGALGVRTFTTIGAQS